MEAQTNKAWAHVCSTVATRQVWSIKLFVPRCFGFFLYIYPITNTIFHKVGIVNEENDLKAFMFNFKKVFGRKMMSG